LGEGEQQPENYISGWLKHMLHGIKDFKQVFNARNSSWEGDYISCHKFGLEQT
jgi:hypothetical protein